MSFLKVMLAIFAFFILFSSCHTRMPISQERPINNPTYEVAYLFEHDGCKVYRFRDSGNYVYFTNCNGSTTSVVNDSTRVDSINQLKIIEKQEN